MAIVVDEPIINVPFSEPTRHYRMRGGQAELVDARRPSGFTPGLRTRGGQSTLLEEEYVELPVVNDIRGRVRRWRDAGYPGASRTTLDLLRHWRTPGRERPLFFCQLEAAETAIWLAEGPVEVRHNAGQGVVGTDAQHVACFAGEPGIRAPALDQTVEEALLAL